MRSPGSNGNGRVSVIVPCFNDGTHIAEAVGSIREEEPVEVIVVDDGSTDSRTGRALKDLEMAGIRVLRHPRNLGVSAARNSALDASSGIYIYPLDADDLIPPGALAWMADRLDADPDACVCYGDVVELSEGRLRLRSIPPVLDPFQIAYTNRYPATALYRRTVLKEVGGWRRVSPQLDARSDWSLWMSLAELGCRGVHLGPKDPVLIRRLGRERLGDRGRAMHRHLYACLREAHPVLFKDLRASRRASGMNPLAKLVYPILFGVRRRTGPVWWITRGLDRLGVWRQRRLSPDDRERFRGLLSEARR